MRYSTSTYGYDVQVPKYFWPCSVYDSQRTEEYNFVY
uniref:Uncharacterized protein n=1 Tax=Anguilla anguilla TaxID=7936 RepID=A0A0E9Q0E5_ANGAN